MTVLLAIATATSQVGVALSGAGRPPGLLAGPPGPPSRRAAGSGHRDRSPAWPGIGMQQIGRVAVDIGPGLFTGLRVGVATAKALAAALDIPIVGCSSLELLAYPHRRQDRLVAAVVDAKRGEVFWALVRPGSTAAGPR